MLKMKDYETMGEHYARIKEIVNQMKIYGESVTNKNMVNKLLIIVTKRYDLVLAAIDQAKNLSSLS